MEGELMVDGSDGLAGGVGWGGAFRGGGWFLPPHPGPLPGGEGERFGRRGWIWSLWG